MRKGRHWKRMVTGSVRATSTAAATHAHAPMLSLGLALARLFASVVKVVLPLLVRLDPSIHLRLQLFIRCFILLLLTFGHVYHVTEMSEHYGY
ncbi:hypothetical protein CRYUN_Cryun10bG0053200 [Craigia yunnanensis]